MVIKEIAGRIKVDLLAGDFASPDEYSVAATDLILAEAKRLAGEEPVVWVEVQYRLPSGEWDDWDKVGDALEVDFTADPPLIRTLTSEEWQGASA